MSPSLSSDQAPAARASTLKRLLDQKSASEGAGMFVVTERQWPGEPVAQAFRRLAAELQAKGAELLALMIYSSNYAQAEIDESMRT